MAAVTGAISVSTEIASLLKAHARDLVPYLAAHFGVHFFVQYGIPIFKPDAFDFLGFKQYGAKLDAAARRKVAIDARTKAICILMAAVVTVLSIQTLLSPEAAVLQSDFFTTTPTTTVLVKIAVAFFCWDVYVCLTEWAGWAYLGHAIACLCVFTCALKPMLHYMAAVTLLYEASTPFLHVRLAMIQSESAQGALFQVMQLGFAFSFFLARIVIGYWKCWQWWWQVEAFLVSSSALNSGVIPAVLRMYQVMCLFLSGLNGWWFWQIAQKAVGGAPSKEKSKKKA